jgi:hypothetical protein
VVATLTENARDQARRAVRESHHVGESSASSSKKPRPL